MTATLSSHSGKALPIQKATKLTYKILYPNRPHFACKSRRHGTNSWFTAWRPCDPCPRYNGSGAGALDACSTGWRPAHLTAFLGREMNERVSLSALQPMVKYLAAFLLCNITLQCCLSYDYQPDIDSRPKVWYGIFFVL